MNSANIEDIYTLSPMQQGMLFHSLYTPEASVYTEQMSCTLHGRLNVPAFERAWQRAVDHHPILRTAFVWEGVDEPLQVVMRRVELPLEQHDWRGLAAAEQATQLEAFLQADHARGFELSQAPLMRLTLLQTSEDAWQLVWTYHHVLIDGWSLPLLLKQVFGFYEAFHRGLNLDPEPSRPYRDYIVWLQQQDLAKAEVFWRETLKGFATPTPLVVDWADGNTAAGYAIHRASLPAKATEMLQVLARQHQLTLNTLVQGAWALLLSRYSGEQDVVFGATVSGRPTDLAGAETMLGLFINTLPVRVHTPPDASLLPWLKELQARQVELRQYEYNSLVQIQGWSDVPRGTPLFESILVFENYPMDASVQEPGGSLEIKEVHSFSKTNYPLTVAVTPGREVLFEFAYDGSRFDEATIQRLAGHLCTLLESIASDPTQRLATVSLLTEVERHQLLAEWSHITPQGDATARLSAPREACIHQLFQAQVERTPNAVAVLCAGEGLTYWELNQRANQLAHHLRALGVGPDVLVGLCVERSLEMVIGLLGILKAGGAYLPLDPAYPQARLSFMLQDSAQTEFGMPVLLTQSHLLEHSSFLQTAQSLSHRVLCLDTDWHTIEHEGDKAPASSVTPDHLAYVIYTSGSTGQPKGVMVRHGGLVNHALATANIYELTPADRMLQFISLSFDASAEEIFPTLVSGATLVLWQAGMELSQLAAYCEQRRVTILHLPVAFWHQWVDQLDPGGWLSSVRILVVGGESPSVERLENWVRLAGQCKFINAYGPTEATVATTVYQAVCDESITKLTKIPIGRPIANAQVYLLDHGLQPVPIGVPGELYIGGAGLARGYLNRPELTAERFIPDPFCRDMPSACLYKTGDLARYLPDGNIEFIGRTDDQVKVRGFRIELGEIESALGQHPALREAVVIAREDQRGDRRLAAYVVPSDERQMTNGERETSVTRPSSFVGELRAFLREHLPEYMLPSVFVTMEALPRLPNGKVDRRTLPAPRGAFPELETAYYVAPRTPTEELLAGIWAHVLGVEQVGVHDNFFDLGGHSLLATLLISRLREAFGVELPLRSLFESPTVAGLASHVEAVRSTGAGLTAPPIQPAPRDATVGLPLSFAQQRLWFLDQLEPNNSFYNNPTAIRLTGQLDLAALERSLNEIVRRHESLRTTFAAVGGRPTQVIAPEFKLAMPIIDMRGLPKPEREAEALRRATEETQRPFDLARGPLLRAQLLQLGEQEYVALLTLHHIVSDGWSMGVIIREIAALYSVFSEARSPEGDTRPSPLPGLPIQYADFARWQREWLQGETLQAHLAYWKQQLADSPPMLELPTDRSRPAIQTSNGSHLSFTLPCALAQSLKQLSRQEGVTLFMTLLAGFQTLLYRYTGQEIVNVGTPIANRNRAEIENLIGFFVNTLVMRGNLSGEPSFRDVLVRVREAALGAYAHQDLPFEMLVEALHPERDLSHAPLFQVMFVLDNEPRQVLELPGLMLSPVEAESGTARFDITLSMAEEPDGLNATIEYNTDLFNADTIVRMAGHFQTLLEGIVADPDRHITTLPLLTEAERRQMLVEWNNTATDFPREACIHELFEQQVEQRPYALAVTYEGEQLTYLDLNRRANQVARYLRKLGVGPDVLVGICTERSLEMVVGILGILKAGSAYLPLDPTYPAERLGFMLQDSAVPVLLTQLHLAERLPAHAAQVVHLDADWEAIAQESDENVCSGATAEDLAYVIYTSGSTGKPKGVVLRHRGLCNLATWHHIVFDMREGKRVLQFSPFSFDASVWEVFMALRNGATLCLARQETLASGPDLVKLMREQHVTTATLPPTMLLTMPVQDLPELETIIAAGEACPRELVMRWGPGRRFFNAYGPTETTVCTSMAQCDANDPQNPSIGKPIANTQLYILDAHLQPVPIGVPGELCVGGVSLARGYLNRPELTEVKFVRDPFSHEPGACLYRTGDLVRYRADGDIEFLGRIDQQVKVRGFRIELGEIEMALCRHPMVQEAAVITREDIPGDKRLVAYVVLADPSLATSELRVHLRECLPEYMVPSAFVVMAEGLPLSPSGKVDRKALPAPEGARPDMERAYVAPRTPTEETLASLCAELLGLDRVGVFDSFFDLGGHSLLATQFISRLRDTFQVELPLRSLFEHPTIAELATAVEQAERTRTEPPAPPLVPLGRDKYRMKRSELEVSHPRGGNGSSDKQEGALAIAHTKDTL